MKNLQIYTYAIKENYKPHILGINQRLPYQHSKYATSQPHGHQSASTWFPLKYVLTFSDRYPSAL